MAKKKAVTVSVMPVRENPDALILQSIFNVSLEEFLVLKLCASGPRPSDCTAKQRLLLRTLNSRYLVEVIEYPWMDGPRWVLSTSGEAVAHTTLLTSIRSAPAKVLQFPSAQ